MNCDYCGRDLTGDKTVKVARASRFPDENTETKHFCDGPTVSDLERAGYKVDINLLRPSPEEKAVIVQIKLCAQVYKDQKAMYDGMSVSVHVEEK